MSGKDPYKILGVSRTASADEVKQAYRRLAKQHHPDRNPGDRTAELRFKEVQAAYEVLGDAERRAQFDRFGEGGPRPDVHAWRSQGAPDFEDIRFNFNDMGDLGSIFEQFFTRGGGMGGIGSGRRGGSRRGGSVRAARSEIGSDLEHSVDLSFDEAMRGTRRQVLIRSGENGAIERIEVHIPAGVASGQKVRVRGKGNAGPGGRGDLYIACRVQPHAYFRAEGLDVVLELPLSLAEAALGAKVEIPTLDGPTLLTVPPGASSGMRLRLRGKGGGDGRTMRGDMLVAIRILAPRELTPRARELLETLAGELKQSPRTGWPG
ncbi:Curved DNA-binding protein [Phycisphaerae bacterium RAS1]|nr:Curved DNA-binding protein [Phycisphaerae bacterium RAS1]